MRIAALLLLVALAACSPPAEQLAATTAEDVSAEGVSIVVAAPQIGAHVRSPLHVEGTAPGDWFFEAQFPAELRAPDGAVIAEAPARAQADWMTERPVPYAAELEFDVERETQATLVLKEDMPSGLPGQREISIPVVLEPAD